jgi:hypothetical protein
MREDLLVCLGLAERREAGIELIENPVVVVLTKNEMENFRILLREFLDLWKLRYQSKYSREVKKMEVQYPAQLPLNEWFHRNCDEVDEDGTCLFKNLDKLNMGCFFEKWNVEFEAPIKKVRIKRELNDTMIASDEGMTHFLSCFVLPFSHEETMCLFD